MRKDNNNGSILIFLIAVITILSVLGAAMLSFTDTSLLSSLSLNNHNKAKYFADSGVRYTELTDNSEWYFEKETSFTILDNNNTLEIHSPSKIESAGFNIELTDCNIESTGIVNEDTPFEASHTVSSMLLRDLPCWKFDTLTDNTLVDSCGNNRGQVKGTGVSRSTCDKKISGAWDFGGSDYIKTLFRPYCEIGDQVSFSVSFWVKPQDTGNIQTVLWVSSDDSPDNSFKIGINTDDKWEWSYGGDISNAESDVIFDEWQHIIFIYDNDNISAKKVHFKIQNCLGYEDTKKNINNTGTAGFPYSNKHMFIGAENNNDTQSNFFQGKIDELKIIKYDSGITNINDAIDELSPLCPIAYYPLDGNSMPEITQEIVNNYDGESDGFALRQEDRFVCPDKANFFLFIPFIKESNSIYVDFSAPISFPLSDYPFTINAWIKKNNTTSKQAIFSITKNEGLNEDPNVILGIYIYSDGKACLYSNMNGVEVKTCSESSINDNSWHMVTGVFANQMDPEFRLYVHGYEETEETIVKGEPFDSSVNRWSIGRDSSASKAYFTGTIDDVSIYNKALTFEDISKLYEDRLVN